jgi:hypothetical protein
MKLIVSLVVILHISMHRPTFAYDHLGNQDENESIVDRFLTWVTKWINVCRLDSTDSITFRNVRMHPTRQDCFEITNSLALAKRIATRATFVQKASFEIKMVIARAFAWMWIVSRVKLALVDACVGDTIEIPPTRKLTYMATRKSG